MSWLKKVVRRIILIPGALLLIFAGIAGASSHVGGGGGNHKFHELNPADYRNMGFSVRVFPALRDDETLAYRWAAVSTHNVFDKDGKFVFGVSHESEYPKLVMGVNSEAQGVFYTVDDFLYYSWESAVQMFYALRFLHHMDHAATGRGYERGAVRVDFSPALGVNEAGEHQRAANALQQGTIVLGYELVTSIDQGRPNSLKAKLNFYSNVPIFDGRVVQTESAGRSSNASIRAIKREAFTPQATITFPVFPEREVWKYETSIPVQDIFEVRQSIAEQEERLLDYALWQLARVAVIQKGVQNASFRVRTFVPDNFNRSCRLSDGGEIICDPNIPQARVKVELCTLELCGRGSPSGSILPAESEVLRFRVSVTGSDAGFSRMRGDYIGFKITQVGGTAQLRRFAVIESPDLPGARFAFETQTSFASSPAFLAVFENVIAENSFKVYAVFADLRDYATTGETFRVDIVDMSMTGTKGEIELRGLPLIGGILTK